jgi:hypothetical protein
VERSVVGRSSVEGAEVEIHGNIPPLRNFPLAPAPTCVIGPRHELEILYVLQHLRASIIVSLSILSPSQWRPPMPLSASASSQNTSQRHSTSPRNISHYRHN